MAVIMNHLKYMKNSHWKTLSENYSTWKWFIFTANDSFFKSSILCYLLQCNLVVVKTLRPEQNPFILGAVHISDVFSWCKRCKWDQEIEKHPNLTSAYILCCTCICFFAHLQGFVVILNGFLLQSYTSTPRSETHPFTKNFSFLSIKINTQRLRPVLFDRNIHVWVYSCYSNECWSWANLWKYTFTENQ